MPDEAINSKEGTAKPAGTDLSKAAPQSHTPRSDVGGDGKIKLIAIAVAAVLVIAVVYVYISHGNGGGSIFQSTTSVNRGGPSSEQATDISACTTITKPGTYNLTKNITTMIGSGSCLSVQSSDVRINGNGWSLRGSGLFLQQGPSTYGISIYFVHNVTINNMAISKFSYGVLSEDSNYVDITNTTVRNATESGIYMNYSSYGLLYADRISGSTGQSGGITLVGGSDNLLVGIDSNYNSYYGLQLLNSVGNGIYNSTLIGNPVDLACSANASYAQSNKFSNTTCYINNQCEFAYCSEVNSQFSLSGVQLGSNIDSCGSIDNGGTYTLNQNLNMANYLNVSAFPDAYLPCISVNASNVDLQCNGHTIMNAPYGIVTTPGQYNITVTGCNFRDSHYGLFVNNTVAFDMRSIGAYNGGYGIYVLGSSNGNVTNVTANGNQYGIYFNSSVYDTLSRYTADNNTYGVTIDNSTNINFVGGSVASSTKTDFYCTPSTYNSTLFSMTETSCTTSDCNWASSCPVRQLPNLNSSYPVTSCATINAPGQYSLHDNVIASGTCFNIDSDNVSIDCAGHNVIGTDGGTAFVINGKSNVVLLNCNIQGFAQGVSATDSQYVVMKSSTIDASTGSGISLNDSQSAVFSNVLVKGYTGYGFTLYKDNLSTFVNNTAESQVGSYGFRIRNSYKNIFLNNSASYSNYGFFIQNSTGNHILNNTALSSRTLDFYCDPASSGVYAQTGDINTGVTNAGCYWLVETSATASTSQSCTPINSADTVAFSQDEVYPYGATCFNIKSTVNQSSSGTTINCNGHTVLATHGGTFVSAINTSNINIENCVLIGFNTPISISASKMPISGITIFNNTIAGASTAISIYGAKSSFVQADNITNNSGTAISLTQFNYSQLENNIINDSDVGAAVYDSTNVGITNNTVDALSQGIALTNVTFSTMLRNHIVAKTTGLYCSGSSATNNGGNRETGQNYCSSQSGCAWVLSATC